MLSSSQHTKRNHFFKPEWEMFQRQEPSEKSVAGWRGDKFPEFLKSWICELSTADISCLCLSETESSWKFFFLPEQFQIHLLTGLLRVFISLRELGVSDNGVAMWGLHRDMRFFLIGGKQWVTHSNQIFSQASSSLKPFHFSFPPDPWVIVPCSHPSMFGRRMRGWSHSPCSSSITRWRFRLYFPLSNFQFIIV